MSKYKKIYLLAKVADEDEETFWCISRKIRKQLYNAILICDYEDHYTRWLDLHNIASNKKTWKQYLKTVQPTDNWYFAETFVEKDDPLLKLVLITQKPEGM